MTLPDEWFQEELRTHLQLALSQLGTSQPEVTRHLFALENFMAGRIDPNPDERIGRVASPRVRRVEGINC